MSLSLAQLFEPTVLGAGITLLFTADVHVRLDKLTISNPLGVDTTIAIHLVPAGALANQGNQILPPFPVVAGQSVDAFTVMGHVLGPGDSLRAIAGAANTLVAFGSGIRAS